MDVRDHSNLPNLWLNTAPSIEDKDDLFKKTKSAISEIKFGDPLEAFKLSNNLAVIFQNFKEDQCKSICNLVARMGERGARKLNKLFEAILSSQRNQKTTDKQVTAFVPENPSSTVDPLTSWINQLQIGIQKKLETNTKESNPDGLFIPLPNDIINYMKSNFLDAFSISQLNNTRRVPETCEKKISLEQIIQRLNSEEKTLEQIVQELVSEGKTSLEQIIQELIGEEKTSEEKISEDKINREKIIKKDLIMLINSGRISLSSMGIHILKELIDYLGKDVKLVTRLVLCSEEGLVEKYSTYPSDMEFTQLQNYVTRNMFNMVLEHFPNLRELIINDPLDEDLAELLSQDAFANQLKEVPIEKLTLNCSNLTNIDFLNHFPKLTQIELNECRSLGLIDASKYFSRIKYLEFYDCINITGLETLSQLEKLSLKWVAEIKSLDLSNLKNLISLDLHYCEQLKRIKKLESLVNLQKLQIFKEGKNRDMVPLNFASLINLEILSLDGYSANLTGLDKLKSLNQLRLTGCAKLTDYNFIKNLTNLYILQMDNLEDEYANNIASLKNLICLDLKGSKITSIDFLKDLKELFHINLERCTKLHDLKPLRHHPSLNFLSLNYCNNIADITPLSHLPLKELRLIGIHFIAVSKENKRVFKTIPTLTHLDLSDQYAIDAECLAAHPALNEVYVRNNIIYNQEELLKIPFLECINAYKTTCSKEIIENLMKKGVRVYQKKPPTTYVYQ